MSASKTFRDIGVEDICVLDYEANLVAGPKPPGFKWFHAQLLRERKDVRAVVHTHDVHGRAYALSKGKWCRATASAWTSAAVPCRNTAAAT